MPRTIGVEQARATLGQLAQEISEQDEAIILTRRGQPVAVMVSPAHYDELVAARRRLAQEELGARLQRIRDSVAAADLDVSVVDEAITAARAAH